jgi:hypothetical protein
MPRGALSASLSQCEAAKNMPSLLLVYDGMGVRMALFAASPAQGMANFCLLIGQNRVAAPSSRCGQAQWCSAKTGEYPALSTDHRIHPAKTLTEYAHHIERKAGRLLGEKKKAFLIDRRQSAVGQRGDGCRARRVIDQRHLAHQAAGGKLFKYFVAIADPEFARQYDIHVFAGVAFLEKTFARFDGHNIFFVFEKTEKARFEYVLYFALHH